MTPNQLTELLENIKEYTGEVTRVSTGTTLSHENIDVPGFSFSESPFAKGHMIKLEFEKGFKIKFIF